jgi:HK97 family phage major capsid protein
VKLTDLIAQMRADATAKLAERNPLADELNTLRRAATPDEERIEQVRKAKDDLDAELDQIKVGLAEREAELKRDEDALKFAERLNLSPAVVTREERTYSESKAASGQVSFFRDAYLFTEKNNPGARERLERHATEVEREGEMSERAASTGSFAGLIVPQYLVDQAALVARAGRPVANSVTRLQIPEQGMSFVVPRGTTGAATAVQATENSAVQNTDEVWANVTVPVATVAGQQQVSRQSLERGTPGIDSLIYMDLAGAYGVNVDQQVISGSGASGQVLGILNTSGINQASAFTAAATAQTLYTKTAGQVNAVQTSRFLAPTVIWMHPRRWNWLLTQFDSQNRPLVVPTTDGSVFDAYGIQDGAPVDIPSAQIAGYFQGLPVVLDASIPTSVGTGPEDQMIVARAADLILWEDGDGLPRELRFEQTLGNQLTTTLVAYNYVAFTAARYATAVGVVGGNSAAGFGLVAPTF